MSNKKSTTATTSVLGELHRFTAETIMEQIKYYREYVDQETGTVGLPIPPALLAQSIKFLKDNNISAHEDDEALQALKQSFKENVVAFPFKPSASDAQAAG